MTKLMIVLLVAGCASVADAEPFWIAWEGDTYPEEDGWERYTRAGGAERSLEDGKLMLDGMASTEIVDIYYIQTVVVPDPGEQFLLDWRLRVDEVEGFADPLVAVRVDDLGAVFLRYSEDAIYSLFEDVWIDFTPGVFHEYSFTSVDMATYELHVDGQLAHTGYFVGPWGSSGVTWGDATEGASSVSTWDYVRFGVVPEPSAGLMLPGLALITLSTAAMRRIRNEKATL
ncbi:MAG: hypothetical protein ABIG44_08030 [Planctomycetota bacterium]